MESVLWSVWNGFGVVLTPTFIKHNLFTLFQKYIQNMVKNVDYHGGKKELPDIFTDGSGLPTFIT